MGVGVRGWYSGGDGARDGVDAVHRLSVKTIVLLNSILPMLGNAPVKCSCEDQVVVCRELLQASLKFALVDEAAGLVNDDE